MTARAEAPTRMKGKRVASLDVARGWMLLTSVSSAAVVTQRPPWLVHAVWRGITIYDLIFPLFVTLSGVGMAFAYRNRVSHWVSLRRVVVLLVVGLIYGGLTSGNWAPGTFRVTGTLQLYAALVALLAAAHLVARGWRAWAGVTLGVGTVLAVWLRLWANGCPGGELTPACNPSATIDGALFGARMYAEGRLGHDPEGIVAILGAFITASAGVTAGHMALELRRRGAGPFALAAWAGLVAVWGLALTALVPAFKRLWTPSFALTAAALGIVLFGVAFLLFDVPRRVIRPESMERLAAPFAALGRNSLLVYFGSHLAIALLWQLGEPWWAGRIADVLGTGAAGPVLFAVANVAAWWLLAIALHRRRIYVHA